MYKFGKLTVRELQERLRNRGAKISGKKAELVKRYVVGNQFSQKVKFICVLHARIIGAGSLALYLN